MISLIIRYVELSYVESNIYKTAADIDIEDRPVVAKGEGLRGGMEWEVGVNRCKLFYVEQINNMVPQYTADRGHTYSTEDYLQYPMIKHCRKRIFKKKVYI